MTNLEMLQRKITESGLGPVAIAAAWGVSMPTYYKLLAGEREFTASMIVASQTVLHLSLEDRDLIFFA